MDQYRTPRVVNYDSIDKKHNGVGYTVTNFLYCGCGSEHIMARVDEERQALVLFRRMHGTYHTTTLTLAQLVYCLDPEGTTYNKANGTVRANSDGHEMVSFPS